MPERVPQQVLVTGGTGFIGRHLVDRLLQNGYAVTCMVRNVRKLHSRKALKKLYGESPLFFIAPGLPKLRISATIMQ